MICKPTKDDAKNERIHIASDRLHMVLVRGGKQAYLWVGDAKQSPLGYISGATTLRALARAILREIPAPRRSVKP